MSQLAHTPEPPYYAVIFTSVRTDVENREYGDMAQRMLELAAQQPGYLGVENARTPGEAGITVSYWKDEDSIRNWRDNAEHKIAQGLGRAKWYESFALRIARVETERIMES